MAEHELMETIVTTYGKTWHTWHTDQHWVLPYGSPSLMMGFTQDGQLNRVLEQSRDQRFNLKTSDRKTNRADIPVHPVQPGADAWQTGEVIQLPDLTKQP